MFRSIHAFGLPLVALVVLYGTSGSATARNQDEKVIPAPQDVTVSTRDGVDIHCTFYPGGFVQREDEVEEVDGKNVVPVMLVHGWGGQRGEFEPLARQLQQAGHAVIVPDLRGHGRSTVQETPAGSTRQIDPDRMSRHDIARMVDQDLEAVKRWLMTQNNEGRLNIEMLCVVGSELGSLLALNWAAQDWSWPQLPTLKQGQDVKAVVLISPIRQFKGYNAEPALRHPAIRNEISLMIVAGRDSANYSDARRWYNTLRRFHGAPPEDREEQLRDQTLFLIAPDTSLSGTTLLGAEELRVAANIRFFIHLRLQRKASQYHWQDRSR